MKGRVVITGALAVIIALGAATYALAAPGAAKQTGTPAATTPTYHWVVTASGPDGQIAKAMPITDLSHEIVTPYDPSSGDPSSSRAHNPVAFGIAWGANALKFLQAQVNTANLKVSFILVSDSSNTPAATIALTNAHVVHYNQSDQTARFQLTYQKVVWTMGSVVIQDIWNQNL